MHRTLIEKASDSQLREFTTDILSMLKETNHDLYEELEISLYKKVYGKHFSDWLLEKATKDMINEDGTIGPHWTVEQTTNAARNNGITFKEYNEYDWNYVMNMIYSDYFGAVNDDTNIYARMAKKFLQDKDAKEGKALCYYLAMR
jgi:hypothetical protein